MLTPVYRFIAQYGGSCGAAVETAGRRMVFQMESRLRENLERVRLKDQTPAAGRNSIGYSNHLETTLNQLLSVTQTQASRLAKLEASCFSSPGAGMGLNSKIGPQFPESVEAGNLEQEVTSLEVSLKGLLSAVLQARERLDKVLSSSDQRHFPAGKICILPPAICPHVLSSSLSFSIMHAKKPSTLKYPSVLTY